jgi:hypothetical protein
MFYIDETEMSGGAIHHLYCTDETISSSVIHRFFAGLSSASFKTVSHMNCL